MNSLNSNRSSTNQPKNENGKDFGFINKKNIEPTPLSDYHLDALESYQKTPFPTHNDEAWRRTSLIGLELNQLELLHIGNMRNIIEGSSTEYAAQLLLSRDKITQDVNKNLVSEKLIFTDIRNAAVQYPELLNNLLGKVVKATEGKFAALSAAFAQQGIFLYVPKNVKIELPVYSKIDCIKSSDAFFSHLVIWLEEGASITYFHEYTSPHNLNFLQSFHGGIVELNLGENASLKFVELQKFGKNVWSVTHERALLQKNAHLEWIYGSFGSGVSKNFIDADLIGKNATANINGLYLSDESQHFDLDTQQNHLETGTSSNLKFKGVLFDESYAVWQGMVYVSPKAIQTDGYQSNDNLILSGKAHARSIPGLEILADDVKCSHGATISRINDDELFYLQSRGINTSEAEKLIVKGFFSELTSQIENQKIRNKVEKVTELRIDNRIGLINH